MVFHIENSNYKLSIHSICDFIKLVIVYIEIPSFGEGQKRPFTWKKPKEEKEREDIIVWLFGPIGEKSSGLALNALLVGPTRNYYHPQHLAREVKFIT